MHSKNPWKSAITTLPNHTATTGLQHVLSIGEELGLLSGPASDTSGIQDFCTSVTLFAETAGLDAGLKANVEEEQADLRVFLIAGSRQSAAKAKLANEACQCLVTLLQHKDTVVNRLQQPCQGASLPVENVGQAALIGLLQRAAMQPNDQPANDNLEWALQFRDKPACWSTLLQPAPDASSAISMYHTEVIDVQNVMRNICKLVLPEVYCYISDYLSGSGYRRIDRTFLGSRWRRGRWDAPAIVLHCYGQRDVMTAMDFKALQTAGKTSALHMEDVSQTSS